MIFQEPIQYEDSFRFPKTLQFQYTKTINLTECTRLLTEQFEIEEFPEDSPLLKLDKNSICTINPIDKGFCIGDSGSALARSNTLIGVVSWSVGCARGYPEVYVNVYEQLDWIRSEMRNLTKYK